MSLKEVHLANTSDLHDGEMKEITVDERRILLARVGDKKNNRVLAVAGMNRDREMAAAEELLRLGLMPTREQLHLNDRSLAEMLQAPESINA